MPYILTVDQRRSQRGPDLVPEMLDLLGKRTDVMRTFERTAGDEFQGVLADPEAVVDIALDLVRRDDWSVGIGTGPVEEPLPPSARAGRGPAYVHARAALDAAKRDPQHLAVVGPDGDAAHEADVLLTLLAAVVQRRSDPGWEAVDLLCQGLSVSEAAERLKITRQAVGQRLAAALWQQEEQARPLAGRLLEVAHG